MRIKALYLCIPTCFATSTSAPTTISTTTSLSESTTASEPTCVESLYSCFQLCGAARSCAGKCYDALGISREDVLICKRSVCSGQSFTPEEFTLCNIKCACAGPPTTEVDIIMLDNFLFFISRITCFVACFSQQAPTCPPLLCDCNANRDRYPLTFLGDNGCPACRCVKKSQLPTT